MEPLSNRSKKVQKREMTFAERAYLPAIAQGLGITLKHFFKKKATIQYPEQTRQRSDVWRGLHVLKRDEQGRER
ncbi:MAG TPA: NADH-quinone oxidoreductase subunit I, partial [Pontibacter sp.]